MQVILTNTLQGCYWCDFCFPQEETEIHNAYMACAWSQSQFMVEARLEATQFEFRARTLNHSAILLPLKDLRFLLNCHYVPNRPTPWE